MEAADGRRGARRASAAAWAPHGRTRGRRRRADRLGERTDPRRGVGQPRVKILGLDPGLGTTGWGLIRAEGNRLSHIANGQIKTDTGASLPRRLAALADQLEVLIADHAPTAA